MRDVEQLPLFALDEGRAARDAGSQLAADHAGLVWQEVAYRVLKGLALTKREIHTDDLAEACDLTPPHPNAWGAIWLRAIRTGLIARTGQYRPSRQKGKHAHQYPVYASLVYGRAAA